MNWKLGKFIRDASPAWPASARLSTSTARMVWSISPRFHGIVFNIPRKFWKWGRKLKSKSSTWIARRNASAYPFAHLPMIRGYREFEKFSVGQLVEGVITRLTKFGAFARLEGDIEGLIHISEMADHRIDHPKEVLKEGEVHTLRVIRIDPDQHRIGLSLRKVNSGAYADQRLQETHRRIRTYRIRRRGNPSPIKQERGVQCHALSNYAKTIHH